MCGPLKVPSKRAQENMRIAAVNNNETRGDSAGFAITSLLNWMIAENGPNTREVEPPKKLTRKTAVEIVACVCQNYGFFSQIPGESTFYPRSAGEAMLEAISRAQGGFDE